MRFRKLRITWTVFCAIACMLLIMWWVRSYLWTQVGSLPLTEEWSVSYGSYPGVVAIGVRPPLSGEDGTRLTLDADDWWLMQQRAGSPPYSSRVLGYFGYGSGVVVFPYWSGVLLAVTLAVAPWTRRLRWRFTLRTLLIAITAVAVVLGVIVWAMR
jgi:hypothetical protein